MGPSLSAREEKPGAPSAHAPGHAPGPAALRRAAALTRAALLTLAAATAAHAQDARPAWADEGPLENDVFVPVAEAAAKALFDGDVAWNASLAEVDDGARRLVRVEAFDLWQRALTQSADGDAVPRRAFPPPAGARPGDDARAHEGVSVAVLRRLSALPPDARAAFRARFEELARAALGAARRDPERLAAVEREHPTTRAAATAALWRFEQAFERGRASDARTWLERCARHASLGAFAGDDADVDAALVRRRAALEALARRARGTAGDDGGDAWRDARALELERTIAYPELYVAHGAYGRRGLRPDAVLLDDGRVIVQTDNPVFALDPEDELAPLTFLVSELVEKTLGWPYEQPYGRPGGDWPLIPASDGRRVVLVAGRGSALLCLDPPQPGGTPPRIVWALAGGGWRGPDGSAGPTGTDAAGDQAAGALLGEGRLTFQPGPLVREGRVLVQVRQGDATSDAAAQGRERVRLVALDLESGRPLWSRFVALGSDPLPSSVARFGVRRGLERSGEPLLERDGRVFVGTGFGLGALYDAVDGRLVHAFENRRRDGDAAGWEPARGPRPAPGCGGAPDAILWAPPDSDRLYRIAAGPALAPGAELVVGPIEPLGTASELVGGDGCTALVLDRAGARRGLSAWRVESGERHVSLELGREERFQGSGLVSPERVVLSSDRGVYLFDRTRELYLLDVEPLEQVAGEAGGSLRAHAGRVFVIGRKGLAVLRASP